MSSKWQSKTTNLPLIFLRTFCCLVCRSVATHLTRFLQPEIQQVAVPQTNKKNVERLGTYWRMDSFRGYLICRECKCVSENRVPPQFHGNSSFLAAKSLDFENATKTRPCSCGAKKNGQNTSWPEFCRQKPPNIKLLNLIKKKHITPFFKHLYKVYHFKSLQNLITQQFFVAGWVTKVHMLLPYGVATSTKSPPNKMQTLWQLGSKSVTLLKQIGKDHVEMIIITCQLWNRHSL